VDGSAGQGRQRFRQVPCPRCHARCQHWCSAAGVGQRRRAARCWRCCRRGCGASRDGRVGVSSPARPASPRHGDRPCFQPPSYSSRCNPRSEFGA
jgi:hypothetical protein